MKKNNKKERKIKHKLPIGMLLVLIYIGFILGITLISFIVDPTLLVSPILVGPFLVIGFGSFIIQLTIFIVSALIFYGIIKRTRWTWNLAVIWFIIFVILELLTLILFFIGSPNYYKNLQEYIQYSIDAPDLLNSSIFNLVMGLELFIIAVIDFIILIYITRKKDFFINNR